MQHYKKNSNTQPISVYQHAQNKSNQIFTTTSGNLYTNQNSNMNNNGQNKHNGNIHIKLSTMDKLQSMAQWHFYVDLFKGNFKKFESEFGGYCISFAFDGQCKWNIQKYHCSCPFIHMMFTLNTKFNTNIVAATNQQNKLKLTTGSRTLDNLLGGGIPSHSITEISGEFAAGKTQLCHQLVVTCQFPTAYGGGEGKAIYIDTQNTFRPERIKQIAEDYGFDSDDVLENISYARAYSSDHQMKLLLEAAKMMAQSQYALVIVDSATALFRGEYIGVQKLNFRQYALGKFLHRLLQLCNIFGVAAVITNQVVSDPDGISFASNTKPIGGNIVAHASTTRISLTKSSKNTRVAKICKSPNLPEKECKFSITKQGIVDE